MDSERRHDLETNELREFLDNFKDFMEKHGTKLWLVLVLGLGGFAAYRWYNTWQADQADKASAQLANATSPQTLLAAANDYETIKDEAMRRVGDLSLADARKAQIDGDQAKAKKSLDAAGSAYAAIAERGATVEYQLAGYEGLAKSSVMAEQWDKAQAHYQKMLDLAGEAHPAQAWRAKTGLDSLALLKDPVAFAPEDDLSFDPDELLNNPETPDGTTPPDKPIDPLLPIDPIHPVTPPADPLESIIDPLNPGLGSNTPEQPGTDQ